MKKESKDMEEEALQEAQEQQEDGDAPPPAKSPDPNAEDCEVQHLVWGVGFR